MHRVKVAALACIAGLALGLAPLLAQPPKDSVFPLRPMAAQVSDSAERKLLIELYNAGVAEANALQNSYDRDLGIATFAAPLRAQSAAVEVALELSAGDRKRQIELMKAACQCTQNVESRIEALAKAGAYGGDAAKHYTAQFENLDAKLRLLRLEQPAPAGKSRRFAIADLSDDKAFEAKPGDSVEFKLLAARYVAAVSSVRAIQDAYDRGRSTLHELLHAHSRLLKAGTELPADGDAVKVEVARRHVEAAKTLEASIDARRKAGSQGGEMAKFHASQFHRAEAELHLLALEQVAKSPPKKTLTPAEKALILKGDSLPVNADDTPVQKLLIERYNAGVSAGKALDYEYNVGITTLPVVAKARTDAMKAAWELSEQADVRLGILEALVESTKRQEASILSLAKMGARGGESEVAARSSFERLSAELRLLRFKLAADKQAAEQPAVDATSPKSSSVSPQQRTRRFAPLRRLQVRGRSLKR